MASADIKISIEKTIHDSLIQFLKQISDSLQIQVTRVDVQWIDVSTNVEEKHLISSIDISTSSNNRK